MKQKTIKRWKFLHRGFKSSQGEIKWKIGKWAKPIKDLEICEQGYHCSKGIYQAFSYVQGQILALVECKGKHQSQDDKEVWETMRVIKAYRWTKKDSVSLAVFAARLCLDNFERAYPNDKRPREAIEAAERFIKYPTRSNKEAAESAARSAAWSAARSAAWSAARSAAWSAESAAWSAAWSAESAARSAAWSAESAARSAIVKQVTDWMDDRLKVLKEIKQ